MTELIAPIVGVLSQIIILIIGGLIGLFFTGHIRNFIEMVRINNTITILKKERAAANDQLTAVKKRNKLLEREIEQRDIQIELLKKTLIERDKTIDDLGKHIMHTDEKFIAQNRTIKALEKTVANHLSIAMEREEKIFRFLKKYIQPDMDIEEIKQLLNLDDKGVKL